MSQTTDLVRQLRAWGMTQTEIHRRTGISQPRLSRWEGGDAPAGADDALKLADLVVTVRAERAKQSADQVGEVVVVVTGSVNGRDACASSAVTPQEVRDAA